MIIIFVGKYLFYYVLILQIINFGLIWFVRYKIAEIWGKNTKNNTKGQRPSHFSRQKWGPHAHVAQSTTTKERPVSSPSACLLHVRISAPATHTEPPLAASPAQPSDASGARLCASSQQPRHMGPACAAPANPCQGSCVSGPPLSPH